MQNFQPATLLSALNMKNTSHLGQFVSLLLANNEKENTIPRKNKFLADNFTI